MQGRIAVQVFREPEKLPTPHQAAYQSLPESQMAGQRYDLAEKLLRSYVPGKLLAFMFAHSHAAAACEMLFPAVPPHTSAAHPTAAADASRLPITDRSAVLRTTHRATASGGASWTHNKHLLEFLHLQSSRRT